MTAKPSTLELLPGGYAVAQLEPTAKIPSWARSAEFLALTRTADELSIVAPEDLVPEDVRVERGFRCLRVVGPLAFSQVGILASLALPLAEADIPIFVISTFDTDYLMIPEAKLDSGLAALTVAGHVIQRGQDHN